MNKKEQEEIYNIIIKESFPSTYIHFNEDFRDVGKGKLSFASGKVYVDGVMYEFYWNYRNGINKYTIKRSINES